MTQSENLTSSKKLQPPQKADVAKWISSAVHKLQDKPDIVINSFAACGISDNREACPRNLLAGQEYPDSKDEADDNPFIDELEGLVFSRQGHDV